ncbi:hypothetical protein ACF3NA_10800 [Alkanindiges sp. WGS2144]|uniref:hypothetical protein n=1 Tax=Alkanindiges sp. WGS2144 TaxID=3366808 RepID=UPI003752FD6E
MMKAILGALVVLILGLFLLMQGCSERRDNKNLATQGIEVISEPLDGYTERRKAGVVIGYSVAPDFKTRNGERYHCSGEVSKEVIDRLQGFPVIKVRYLPGKPSVCSVEGEKTGELWFVILLGLGLIIGSLAYAYNQWTLPR